ncbi:DUF6443 domain-containing protein [Microscilla marina]|uniref:RHS Repeat family n=1 Tax=Microscilla marina ATCC 23134 TaxID=313606 RepID=A1ZZW2_MICM2|nr:DUF6443 domain-containing protein [Microscilla marina]EAY24078.1 RHS Repeat family [Microscilla marina ATCC 23134]
MKYKLINYLIITVCLLLANTQIFGQNTHSGFSVSTSVTSSCGSATGTVTVNVHKTFPGSGFVYLQKSTNGIHWTQINPALGEVIFDIHPTNMSFQYHFSGLTQNTYFRAINGVGVGAYVTNRSLVTVNNVGTPSAGTIQGLGSGKFCSYANVHLTLQNYGYSNVSLNNSVSVVWKAKAIDIPGRYVTIASGASCSFPAGDYTEVFAEVRYTTCNYVSTTPVASIEAYHLSSAGTVSRSVAELCVGASEHFVLTGTANTNDFAIVKWQRSFNSGQTWTDIPHTSTVLSVNPSSLNAGILYSYRLVATHKTYKGCNPVYSAVTNISTRLSPPASINTGAVQSTSNRLCAGSSDQAHLSFSLGSNAAYRVVKWQRSSDNGQSWVDIPVATANLSVVANELNAGTTYLYRVGSEHLQYKGCSLLYSATTSIEVDTTPAVPVANQQVFARFGPGPITVSVGHQAGIASYQWVGYPSVIKGNSLTLDYVAGNKNIEVRGVNTKGCVSPPTLIQVQVMPLPVLNASWQYQNEGSILHTLWVASIYDSYQWFKDGLPIDGATQPSYQTTATGTYRLRIVYKGVSYEVVKVVSGEVATPTHKLNKLQEEVVRVKGITEVNEVAALSVPEGQKLQTIRYLDGLGRPIQAVQVQVSSGKRDVVQGVVYDELSRTTKSLLPYTAQNVSPGNARSNVLNELFLFYQNTPNVAQTTYPYSWQKVENSALNRVLQTFAPGNSWIGAGKGVITDLWTNPDPYQAGTAAIDKIRLFTVNNVAANAEVTKPKDELVLSSPSPSTLHQAGTKIVLSEGFSIADTDPAITFEIKESDQNKPAVAGFYAAGQLSRVRVTDEDGKQTEEFKNKSGQVILKRARVDAHTWAQTYYVYNDFGQLSYVLPPAAVKALDEANWDFAAVDAQLDKLWYRYYYDARGRLISKEVPGAGKVMMVYDKRDRLVLSQDANQRHLGKWSFTKYDQLNRPVMTGMYTSTQTRLALQNALDAQFGSPGYASHEKFDLAGTHGYTNVSFPNTALDVHSVTYYDNYAWKNGQTAYDYSIAGLDARLATEPVNYQVTGQVTATKTAVLDAYGERTGWLTTVSYYDARGRVCKPCRQQQKWS